MEHLTRAPAAAAAVLTLALGAAGCGNDTASDVTTTGATPSSSASATPSLTPTERPTGTLTASPSSTPDASEMAEALGDAEECENDELDFEVEYPEAWWANERIEPDFEGGTPIPECTYFAPEPVELQPNAGLPGGIAIWFDAPAADAPEVQGDVLDRHETTVDDHDAVVVEYEPPVSGFSPEGTVIYKYLVAVDDGVLAAMTDAARHPDYEENKEILDAMMETLELED